MAFSDWLDFVISSFNTLLKINIGFCTVGELVIFSVVMFCCFLLLKGTSKK